MMYKRMKTLLGMTSLVAVLVLSACGKEEVAAPASNNVKPPAQSEPAPKQDPQKATETIKGTGQFVGQADTTSVEITVNGEAKVFQLGGDTEKVAQELETNDPVEFEYVEKSIEGSTEKQLVLMKLQKASNSTGGNPAGSSEPGSDLPETKMLSVTLEGQSEQRQAKLNEGDGFAIYVPEGFDFDSKTSKLTMTAFPNYFATITKLPSDYNLDYLALEADQEMSDVGRVHKLEGEKIAEPMRDAKLFMFGDGSKRTKQYIVKEIGGQGYVFRLEIPVGEAAEGFGPLAYAALNSIVTK